MKDGLVLNTWELMPPLLARLNGGSVHASFEVQQGALILTKGRQDGKSGVVQLWVSWPINPNGPVNGILIIVHPAWETLPRILLLVGTGDEKDRTWRFMCPIKRTLHHAVFFDPKNHMFVSSVAIGKRQRQSALRQFVRSCAIIMDLEHKLKNLIPERMSRQAFAELQETVHDAINDEYSTLILATNGIVSLTPDRNGYPDVLAMSEQGRVSWYYWQQTRPWQPYRGRISSAFAAQMREKVKARFGYAKFSHRKNIAPLFRYLDTNAPRNDREFDAIRADDVMAALESIFGRTE